MSIDIVAAGLIGIAGTLVGVLSQYFLSERKEVQTRKTENWKIVVQEVYSPLIFDLGLIKNRGTLRELRTLGMTIPALSQKKTEAQLATFMTMFLRISNQNQSKLLRETLRKNVGLIRPTNLWDDLFAFYDTLDFVEDNLSMFSTGLVSGNSDRFIAHIQGCIQIGAKLDEATTHLVAAMEQISLMDKPPTSLSYPTFFTEDVRKNLVGIFDKVPAFTT